MPPSRPSRRSRPWRKSMHSLRAKSATRSPPRPRSGRRNWREWRRNRANNPAPLLGRPRTFKPASKSKIQNEKSTIRSTIGSLNFACPKNNHHQPPLQFTSRSYLMRKVVNFGLTWKRKWVYFIAALTWFCRAESPCERGFF